MSTALSSPPPAGLVAQVALCLKALQHWPNADGARELRALARMLGAAGNGPSAEEVFGWAHNVSRGDGERVAGLVEDLLRSLRDDPPPTEPGRG